MKDLLRKGLDAYEDHRERRDEAFADLVLGNVEAMQNRRTLKIYIGVLSLLTVLFWAAVLVRPFDVYTAFQKVAHVNDKIVFVVLAAVFGIGMWLTYSLFRFRIPDLETTSETAEIMSSYGDQQSAYRKVRIWVLSVAAGVINLLALAIVELLLIGK